MMRTSSKYFKIIHRYDDGVTRCEKCNDERIWRIWNQDLTKRMNTTLATMRHCAREEGWYIDKGHVLCPDCWKKD